MKFHLEPHSAPVYAPMVAKDGPRLTQTTPGDSPVKDSAITTGEGRIDAP